VWARASVDDFGATCRDFARLATEPTRVPRCLRVGAEGLAAAFLADMGSLGEAPLELRVAGGTLGV
jgi:hypothetical protein